MYVSVCFPARLELLTGILCAFHQGAGRAAADFMFLKSVSLLSNILLLFRGMTTLRSSVTRLQLDYNSIAQRRIRRGYCTAVLLYVLEERTMMKRRPPNKAGYNVDCLVLCCHSGRVANPGGTSSARGIGRTGVEFLAVRGFARRPGEKTSVDSSTIVFMFSGVNRNWE